MTFYIFHRHRVCLVDHVDLICILYKWSKGLGSSLVPPGGSEGKASACNAGDMGLIPGLGRFWIFFFFVPYLSTPLKLLILLVL